MGEANDILGILTIEDTSTFWRFKLAIMNRLTATTDTTARTSHDFNKVITYFASLKSIKQS